jgi:hypothetical protein
MRLGVVDESRTAESREFVSVLTENQTFRLAGVYPTSGALAQALGSGQRAEVPTETARDARRPPGGAVHCRPGPWTTF